MMSSSRAKPRTTMLSRSVRITRKRSVFFERPDPLELRLRTEGWGQLGVWLPPILALLVIGTESTNTFSASNTSGWLRPLFERIFGMFSDPLWWVLHHLFRKTGHFLGYGLVCLTFLRAWLLTLGRSMDLGTRTWRWKGCLAAIASTAAVASLDEWHQTFLPSRTGLVSDVLLDTLGAVVTCGLVWLLCWRKTRRRDEWEPLPTFRA